MKNRLALAKYFGELGYAYGAEIGVFEGRYSEILFQSIPGLKLLCVDNWLPGITFPKKKRAVETLASYNAVIIHKDSLGAAKEIENGSLDFVFIDGEHSYKSVNEDINAWAPKVRIGGIVSLHDYYITKKGNVGVIDAVDEYVVKYGYKLELTDWDGGAGEDDRQPCAYFVKTH